MLFPTLENAAELLKKYKTVPVFYELLTDSLTPVRMFATLKENYDNCLFLSRLITQTNGAAILSSDLIQRLR